MTSASPKSVDPSGKGRRGALAGLLGRKPTEEPAMPAMDVAGGVNRALRAAIAEPARQDAAEAVRVALTTIESALFAVDTLRDILEQALDIAHSAQSAGDAGGRALLAESYDEIRLSISKVIDGLDAPAAGLIGKAPHNLDVKLGGKAHYSVSAMRLDLSPKGLALDPPRDAFATDAEIDRVMADIDAALLKADRAAANFCRDAQFLIARMPQAATA
ncbi:MAG: hypothetical protein K2Q06_15570 [Parvularculaceae bacterium]|nr:hypothetical protein [Parvularculaceae bacterium]